MAANMETMFYTREKPWHGLGVKVADAPGSEEALAASGLDWKVGQKDIFTKDGQHIPGFKANVRESDQKILGIVSDRYKVVQNREAFAFTDKLLGEGVRYETAGSLNGGRKVWVLARMPREYIMLGDRISPYIKESLQKSRKHFYLSAGHSPQWKKRQRTHRSGWSSFAEAGIKSHR